MPILIIRFVFLFVAFDVELCKNTASNFLSYMLLIRQETSSASDKDFKPRRQEACSVACDVLVHRGRQGPFLPTMLVGGFGEATVNASLRLALTIAEHGSQEQHAKLAMSGILVPIGDSLRNALSSKLDW